MATLPGLPCSPVLCFDVTTELPRRHTVVGGVHVVTRKGLTRLLSKTPPVLTAEQVQEAACSLDTRLVPA